MGRLKKTVFEEIKVQVSISYDLNPNKKDDDKLLDIVEDVSDFKAIEQQRWGAYMLSSGFIIFQGNRIPTAEEKLLMVNSVNTALSKCSL